MKVVMNVVMNKVIKVVVRVVGWQVLNCNTMPPQDFNITQ